MNCPSASFITKDRLVMPVSIFQPNALIMKILLPLLALFFLLIFPVETSFERVSAPKHPAEKVSEFLVSNTEKRMLGILEGQVAIDKGTIPDIRAYGELMVKYETDILEQLKPLAAARNIVLPSQVSEKKLKGLNDLKSKTGQKFNKAYAKLMEDKHEEDIEVYKSASKLPDSEISKFASTHVHTLDLQLQRIQKIKDKL